MILYLDRGGRCVQARHGEQQHHGYAGKVGYPPAGAIADFIVVDMIGEAASGAKTPREAAQRAALCAQRYYKV